MKRWRGQRAKAFTGLRVRLVEIEPTIGEPITAELVWRGRKLVVRHDPKWLRGAPWEMPVNERGEGPGMGDPSERWAWRVHQDDVATVAAVIREDRLKRSRTARGAREEIA